MDTHPVLARTTPDLELEVVGLDSQGRLDLELVLGVGELYVEALEDKSPSSDHLLFRDGPARAGSRPGSKSLPRVRRVLLPSTLEETLGPKLVGVDAVDARVVVQAPEVEHDGPFRVDPVLTTDNRLAFAVALDGRDGAQVAKCLSHGGPQVLQPWDMLQFYRVVAQDLVDFLIAFLQFIGMLQEIIHCLSLGTNDSEW